MCGGYIGDSVCGGQCVGVCGVECVPSELIARIL